MFIGVIIKETLCNELFLDFLNIEKTEIWKTKDEQIKYWTMVSFSSSEPELPQYLSKNIIENWFADMKQNNIKYIVFKDCVYQYTIGNVQEKNIVLDALRKRGITDEQFNWDE